MLTATRMPTATSAGITAPGWRASAPFFGVTTNEPLRRSTVNTVDRTWIQKFAAASAKAAKVYEPAPASAAVRERDGEVGREVEQELRRVDAGRSAGRRRAAGPPGSSCRSARSSRTGSTRPRAGTAPSAPAEAAPAARAGARTGSPGPSAAAARRRPPCPPARGRATARPAGRRTSSPSRAGGSRARSPR